ncbi:MAG: C25 family cysteine peptidase, partial [Planctomycetota bacterium]
MIDASQIAKRPTTSPRAIDTLVICPPLFRPVLQPWLDLRAAQGHHIEVIGNEGTAASLRAQIRDRANRFPLRYVVLVGDAEPDHASNPQVRQRSVPTFRAEADVTAPWDEDPWISTDHPYADLNDDQTPELAVGRLSADSPRELQTLIRKIVAYESLPKTGLWRRRIHFVAGLGGFGPITDAVIQLAAKKIIGTDIPASYKATMTFANWRSPYCPDPRYFRDRVLERVREGGLFWIYLGHGHQQRLDRFAVADGLFPILEPHDVPSVQSNQGLPIALLLACHTGAFNGHEDCLAEYLLRTPRGPVAVISGSRVTMPYSMAALGTGFLDAFFEQRVTDLGTLFLEAKRSLSKPPEELGANRKLLDGIAKTLSPSKLELAAEREEHQLLFNLLGDPLLRLKHPEPLEVACRRHVEAEEVLQVTGKAPFGGVCLVELVCRRDRLRFEAQKRRKADISDERLSEMDATYRLANDQRWTAVRLEVQPGPFSTQLRIPREAHGSCYIRLFLQGEDNFALGESPLYVASGSADTRAHARR